MRSCERDEENRQERVPCAVPPEPGEQEREESESEQYSRQAERNEDLEGLAVHVIDFHRERLPFVEPRREEPRRDEPDRPETVAGGPLLRHRCRTLPENTADSEREELLRCTAEAVGE